MKAIEYRNNAEDFFLLVVERSVLSALLRTHARIEVSCLSVMTFWFTLSFRA